MYCPNHISDSVRLTFVTDKERQKRSKKKTKKKVSQAKNNYVDFYFISPRFSVADISPISLSSSLLRFSVADPGCRVSRRNLSSQREALADIKTEVDKNQNVTRRSKQSGIWESVIGLEVHAQVT